MSNETLLVLWAPVDGLDEVTEKITKILAEPDYDHLVVNHASGEEALELLEVIVGQREEPMSPSYLSYLRSVRGWLREHPGSYLVIAYGLPRAVQQEISGVEPEQRGASSNSS